MLSIVPVALPARRPMDSINMYLILNDPVTLIDAGLDTADSEAALGKALTEHNLRWQDIQRVVVTHTHPDHVGLAQKLETRSQASIFMHPFEWDKLQKGLADNIHIYRWAGIPDLFQEISHPLHSQQILSPASFQPLHHQDTLMFADASLTVIHTPGHASGQVCLYAPEEQIMFTSDHLVSNFSPALLVEPGDKGFSDRTLSLSQYLDSLLTISHLTIHTAYPGHGNPFQDIQSLIMHKLHRSIPAKLKRIQGFLKVHPQTVYGIVTDMIPELPPALAFFACGDTLAYLDQLVIDHQAEFLLEGDQILFYRES